MELQLDSIRQAFVLIAVFQLKHFLADFPLQTRAMLEKTAPGWSFLRPLSLHCAVHAAMTLAIAILVRPEYVWLAAVDFITHFVMDRIKAGPRYLGRYSDVRRPAFWFALGFDQMVHHLTHLWIVWKLIFG